MSWSDRAAVFASLSLALALGGCFQPLYGEAAHPGLVEHMREVKVEPIPERIGHYLGDDLITRMNGSGATPEPKYSLKITLAENTLTPTVESQISLADAATLVTDANITLTRIDNGAVVYKGLATSSATYDRSLQSFADLRAARDAEIRNARALSEEIEVRVAAALGQQG